MKICLVSPFGWSQPHDVNEHVAGIAKELRALGHSVTVLAPSARTADLIAGRRALARGEDADVIAIGAAVPVSRRSSLGVPVGVRANLHLALQQGSFDVVHGFEPGLPSISYLALRDSEALGVATFFSPERLGYPPRRALREKLLARIDALLATSEATAAAAAERFPGDYRIVSPGVDTELFKPGDEAEAGRDRAAFGLAPGRAGGTSLAPRHARLGGGAAPDEAALDTTRDPARRCATGSTSAPAARPQARAAILAEAAIVVPAPTGSARLRLEAAAAGAVLADPPGVFEQPELAAAAVARLVEDDALRERRGREARARAEDAELRRAWRRTSTRCIAASPAAGGPASATPSRSPTGRGSSPTCTCTPRGRTTARSRWTSCSTTRRRRASARSRSRITTSSAAPRRRSSRRAGAT